MILIDQVMPAAIESTASFIAHLPDAVEGGVLPYPVEQLVLRCLVDQIDCPLCRAPPMCMCRTYGGQNLRRTHLPRLQAASHTEVQLAIHWAVLEHARQLQEP